MENIMLAELETTTEYGLPEGYFLRGAALDDLPEVVEMVNACSRQLIGADEVLYESMRHEWEIPILNLAEDRRLVIAPNGQFVGYMEVWDLFDPHTRVNVWGRVHPDHQDRGIATALMRWAESRARQAIPRAPDGARVAMLNWINSLDTAAHDVMLRAGFHLGRHSYRMRIDLAEAPLAPVWPDGITLKTFDPDRDLEAVALADREAFRDHWGFIERPFEQDLQLYRHRLDEPRFDPSLWFMAMCGDEVAGICLCESCTDGEPDMGWVGDLGVLRPYRKQGLGLALLRHSFGELYRRGRRKVGLGVDAFNLTGALRLYEKAGMRVYRKFNTYEKELRPGVELSTQTVA
jgi:mycothiol synthase